MTDTPQTTQDHPLVTFALFAYNQENFIQEAVEGAFAQTYEPLEIILSDDCSDDKTFEIMQDLASSYKGPHTVIVRKNTTNLGTVAHIITASREARGKLMIVNAGDDISYPERTASLVACWQVSGAIAMYSDYDSISETGEIIATGLTCKEHPHTDFLFRNSTRAKRCSKKLRSIPGFSSAYMTSFWSTLPLPKVKLLVEDGISTIMLNITGELIEHCASPLIAYRQTTGSLSMRRAGFTTKEIIEQEIKISERSSELIHRIRYINEICRYKNVEIEYSVRKKLKYFSKYGQTCARFWDSSAASRFKFLINASSMNELMFCASRVFGLNIFIYFKKRIFDCRNLRHR